MTPEKEEPYKKDPRFKLWLGTASWDDGTGIKSFKFVSYDKIGRVARGGEIPLDALEQALNFAKREGYL